MSIVFESEDCIKPKFSYPLLRRWITAVINKYDRDAGDITVIFCSDPFLLNINLEFLQHDYFTDIVTFDYCEGNVVSGDIFISVDRVKDNSITFSALYKDELLRVIIHGILHLLGYTDKTESEKNLLRLIEEKFILLFKEMENGRS